MKKKLIFELYIFLLIILIYNFNIIVGCVYAHHFNHKTYNFDKNINILHHISNAHSECLIQIQQQLSKNQHDLNILRGDIQDIQHHILQINNNQKETYKKLNEILNNYDKTYTNNNNNLQLSTKSKLTTLPVIKNTNTILDMHEHSYKQAVSLVLDNKKYDQAIHAFQIFIKNYPNSHYQSNAHYWLGQLYYNKNNKDQASYYFALVTKNYPKSLKAPDALLKIGIIMQESNQTDKAKIIYRQIGKLYPTSNAAKQAQKRLKHL